VYRGLSAFMIRSARKGCTLASRGEERCRAWGENEVGGQGYNRSDEVRTLLYKKEMAKNE